MLYSGTHVATVGVRGLRSSSKDKLYRCYDVVRSGTQVM